MRNALSVYTAVRPGEIRSAEWSEIKPDVWDIPAEKMKMKRRHIVPLSSQVKAVLEELRPITGTSYYMPERVKLMHWWADYLDSLAE